jgi:hypothetical protein
MNRGASRSRVRAAFDTVSSALMNPRHTCALCGAPHKAHARRQFYELHATCPNALNTEALERIGALYRIEESIRGKPPDERSAHRREHAGALFDQFHAWLATTLEALSRNSDTSRAILYALNCSGLLSPDTNLGEDTRHKEVSDEQATSYVFP